MAVFAHPDDEAFSSGGVLAHYANRGVRVTLVCATRGEAGKITDPTLTIEDLGRHREEELRRACRALGIPDPVFLKYHDSGRQERVRKDDPLALMNVDPLDVATQLLDLIEQFRPQVLLTFDPHGGYGHVDHIVMHRATTAAFHAGGSRYAGLARLFYVALPIEMTRRFAEMGMPMEFDSVRYGVTPSTIAVSMNVGSYAQRKLAALQAHGSQIGPNSRMAQLPGAERERFEQDIINHEAFSLGGSRTAIPEFPLRGFFQGIPGFAAVDEGP